MRKKKLPVGLVMLCAFTEHEMSEAQREWDV